MAIGDAVVGGLITGALKKGSKVDPDVAPEIAAAFNPLWELLGDAEEHILQHFETIHPRARDMDLSQNAVQNTVQGEDTTLLPNQTFQVANNDTARYVFVARQGFVAHVTGLDVKALDPTQSMAAVAVNVSFQGRAVQRVPCLDFSRPIMLDRDDRLVIEVTNTSGAAVDLSYAVKGWLRSQGAAGKTGRKAGCR